MIVINDQGVAINYSISQIKIGFEIWYCQDVAATESVTDNLSEI